MFRSIQGKSSRITFPLLDNGQTCASSLVKSNIFSAHYNRAFSKFGHHLQEDSMFNVIYKGCITPHSDLDAPFREKELSRALVTLPCGKAAGPDNISYEFLLHLPHTYSTFHGLL